MKEHPILFAPDMAAASRDGRKTQTRRVVVPQPQGSQNGVPIPIVAAYRVGNGWDFQSADGATQAIRTCPYGVPGDMLRMLTTWAVHRRYDALKPTQLPADIDAVWTAFDAGAKPDSFGKLRPGRFCTLALRKRWMPLAENTDVRVERVWDISEEDAIAEGCESTAVLLEDGSDYCGLYARDNFALLWDRINAKRDRIEGDQGSWPADYGPYCWDANPWVFAVTFVRKP